MKLYDYQVKSVEHLVPLLQSGQNCLDGSDCGVGKTPVACGVIRALDLPTLVLAPQISLTEWRRTGDALGVEFDVLNPEMVQTGKTPFGHWDNPRPKILGTELICDRCQLVVDPTKPTRCTRQRYGIHCVDSRKKAHRYGRFNWNPGIKFLVVDEVHRFGSIDSLNADMLIAARRQGIRVLGLSATAADSPLQLRALGYVLGLHGLIGDDSFYRFAFRMGCRRQPFGGLYFAGDEAERRKKMGELHRLIFPSRGSRVRIADLGESFPEGSIHAELYDVMQPERIESLYKKMHEALEELRGAREMDADPSHPLTKVLRARQEIEILKVPLFQDLAERELEAGNSVALFMAFKATIDELCARLKIKLKIVGGQKPSERDSAIRDYQSDRERVIAASIDAGGVSVSLHDIRGQFPRVGIVSPVFSSIKMRQVFYRLRRIGGKSKSRYRLVLAAKTCEEKIHKAVSAKLNNIDALNDQDLMSVNLPIQQADWPEGL